MHVTGDCNSSCCLRHMIDVVGQGGGHCRERKAGGVGPGADMVLHMGDISYANGEVRVWDAFMRYIEPYASAAPYMIGVGNHEYDYRTGGEKHRKHRHHPDASGSDEPYDPDWGNYGAPRLSLDLVRCEHVCCVRW